MTTDESSKFRDAIEHFIATIIAPEVVKIIPASIRKSGLSRSLGGLIAASAQVPKQRWLKEFIQEFGDAFSRQSNSAEQGKTNRDNWQGFLKSVEKRLQESQNPIEEMQRIREEVQFICEIRKSFAELDKSQEPLKSNPVDWNKVRQDVKATAKKVDRKAAKAAKEIKKNNFRWRLF